MRRYLLTLFSLLLVSLFNSCAKNNTVPAFYPTSYFDDRMVETGNIITKESYIDQPYVIKLPNGNWLCCYTKSNTKEGGSGMTIGLSVSIDKGKTWAHTMDLEPSNGPAASYAVPFINSFGRIFIFYGYNENNVDFLDGAPINKSIVSNLFYKFSDDNGKTWSSRNRINLPVTIGDLKNEWNGKHQMFWSICKPIQANDELFFSFTKITNYKRYTGEGWIINCSNINTEKDFHKLTWNFFPSSDTGIRLEKMGDVQEEHNIVQLNNGSFYCVYRTANGSPAACYSADNCRTWTKPDYIAYATGSKIKNPRACPRVFKCKNGNYLLWFHNNSSVGFDYRNPVWISGGIEKQGKIFWSQPEILLYSLDSTRRSRFSYPDLVEEDGNYFITETQKTIARIHKINNSLLNDLWNQGLDQKEITSGMLAKYNYDPTRPDSVYLNNPTLPFGDFSKGDGITIDMKFDASSITENQNLFSNEDANGKGAKLITDDKKNLVFTLNSGSRNISYTFYNTMFKKDTTQYLALVIDGKSKILTSMINGVLYDGQKANIKGWIRIPYDFSDIQTNKIMQLNSTSMHIRSIRIYNKALTTSQLISNYLYRD